MKKIQFKDLSGWLKTAIVGIWIIIAFYVLVFIIGFIIGFSEGLGY